MTAEEGRWDEVEGDNPEQYYNRSELEQARARMEAEKHMLDQEEDLFKTSDIGFDYQEGGEQEAGEYDPIGEPDIFDTDGQKFIDMFGEPEEAEEDVSVGGPPAGDTIPANGLYIDDEEETPADEAFPNPEESWNLLSDNEKEGKFGDWMAMYSDNEANFAQYNYGQVMFNQLPQGFKTYLGESNPNHDSSSGQFTSGGGSSDKDDTDFEKFHGMKKGQAKTNRINSLKDQRKYLTDDNQGKFDKLVKGKTLEDLSVDEIVKLNTKVAGWARDDSKILAKEWIDDDLALDLSMIGNPEYPPSDQNRDAMISLGLVDPVYYNKLTPAGADVVTNYTKNKSDFPEERPDIINDFSQGSYDAFNEAKATEEQISSDTYYYDYSDYWKKGDAYQRSGLALQAGISTDLANSEWDDLPSDAQAKIRDAGYVTSYEAKAKEQAPEIFGHMVVTDPSSPEPFKAVCDHCGYQADSVYPEMQNHLKQTHGIAVESISTESEWKVQTITHGVIPLTLGVQADEIDAVNAVKRMYFDDGFINEGEIIGVTKLGESLHGYGTEEVTDEEDIELLSRLLNNELEEEEQGDDETEDIALIAQLLGEEDNPEHAPAGSSKGGQFVSKGGGGDSGGKHSKTSDKDIIKSIKGGSKDWHEWGRTEKNEELYVELERRNREVPKPTVKSGGKVFRDDPDAVAKMEQKVKYWEDQKDYWNKIVKFPSRDYKTPNQLGDAKWFMGSNISTNLRDAKKKLE